MEKQEPKPRKKPNEPEENSSLKNFGKYSGMAFQMLAIILIFLWVGRKLDSRFETKSPLYTAILSLLGVIASLYITLKEFISKKDD